MLLSAPRAARLRRWWSGQERRLLTGAIALMAVAAVVWLSYELWRLLFQAPPWGAIDLRHRHTALHGWFAGEPVYARRSVLDPPATHALLWPLLGWNRLETARWVWAATSLLAVVWTMRLAVRHSGAVSIRERTLAALMPAAMYATGATIGNGQLAVHLLPLLIASCVRAAPTARGPGGDLLTGVLFAGALVKPNLAAPFAWILLFVPRSVRPALFAAAGYGALTVLASSFQPVGLATQVREAFAHASAIGIRPVPGNVANLHLWLGLLGLERWILPASLTVIVALGWWVFRHRRVDPWLLMGVTGYVSLFASYHRWYDEVLLLLPMVALFRIAKGGERESTAVAAGVLLALMLASTLAPGGLFLFPAPWNLAYVVVQILIWMTGLAFLVVHAAAARRAAAPAPGATV